MNDQFTKELHDARSDARETRLDALARLCPVEVEQPRFVYWHNHAEGLLVSVTWRDNWTGMEQSFAPDAFLGIAKWKRRLVQLSKGAA